MSDFETMLQTHCIRLYRLCMFAKDIENREIVLNRRFLGKFHLEATWMEETLDSAGARHNRSWFPAREGVSAIKLFSSVTYDLIHVVRSFSAYNLMSSHGDFELEASEVLDELYNSLVVASLYLTKKARTFCIHDSVDFLDSTDFIDTKEIFRLPKNRKLRHIDNPGKTLIYLATQFLSLKSEMQLFRKISVLKKKDYRSYIPGSVSEEKLRLVLVRFHNLQSLYDTYLSESDIEGVDSRLKILRGHISFIFHMLKSATEFSHYYERHIVPRHDSLFFKLLQPIEHDRFLEITIDFFIGYFVLYFNSAVLLCKDVIDSYAEIDEVVVEIPEYRGFHVRPSTLVSKIVNYYGGKVRFYLGDNEYDPSTPLELFRVNEEINALKRRHLLDFIHKDNEESLNPDAIFNSLVSNGNIIVYKRDWEEIQKRDDESPRDYLKRGIELLLASGKIDIRLSQTIRVVGDKRALDDIKLLADSGYGEDKLGNNIALPKALDYLKK